MKAKAKEEKAIETTMPRDFPAIGRDAQGAYEMFSVHNVCTVQEARQELHLQAASFKTVLFLVKG